MGGREADHPLALPVGHMRIAPEAGEVGAQGEDGGALLLIEALAIGLALLVIGVLGGGEQPEVLVPFRFERRGHQPVLRVDLAEAALGQVGLVAGPLHLQQP